MDNNRKTFGQVQKDDIIYTIVYHQATIQIFKKDVIDVSEWVKGLSVDIKYGNCLSSHFCADKNSSRYGGTDYFWKWCVTTTLEEAKEICREMTDERIKSIKKEMRTLKGKLKKWENFKNNIDNGVYIIK